MERRKFIVALSTIAAIGLSGCKDHEGEKFLGKWKRMDGYMTFDISRNGDAFMITDAHSGKKFPAKLNKDGALEFSNGMTTITATIEQNTGHLVFAGEEYARVN